MSKIRSILHWEIPPKLVEFAWNGIVLVGLIIFVIGFVAFTIFDAIVQQQVWMDGAQKVLGK